MMDDFEKAEITIIIGHLQIIAFNDPGEIRESLQMPIKMLKKLVGMEE